MVAMLALRASTLADEELTFHVEVDWTDRSKDGLAFTTFTKKYAVVATNPEEAQLIACQWCASAIGQDDMIIASRVVDVVA